MKKAKPHPSWTTSDVSNDQEWLRVHQFVRRYNVSRSYAYTLIKQGLLRSISLKKRGNIKGIRLICRSSWEAYLESLESTRAEEAK